MLLMHDALQSRTANEWLQALKDAGIPGGPIRNVSGALADQHLAARGFIVELEHPALGAVKSLATPIHMSDTGLSFRHHPPLLGEHTNEILQELGYSADVIGTLLADGIV